jgi:GTP cyclohydrolase IA
MNNPATTLQDLLVMEDPVTPENDISTLMRQFLGAIGENPEREGLQRTPERIAKMLPEILGGYQTDLVSLVNGAIFDSNYQDIVVVRHIQFYSLCEHHLLPFFGEAQVAYIPNGKIIGLSKIPRIVNMYASRLQVQENLTQQIADTLDCILEPKGVAVMLEATHLCAAMRGVKKPGTTMKTRALTGTFQTNAQAREDLRDLLQDTRA